MLWHEKAVENLEKIRRYIENTSFSVEAADSILGEIFRLAQELVVLPSRCPVAKENPALRRLAVGDYNAYYHVTREQKLVQLVAVKHKTADISRHIGPVH